MKTKLRHGSLFSGIGGFDLAAEWMGWDNIFHCEWNEFGKEILNYYWPKSISYEDITKTDFNIHRGRIDVLTGGFPCQPYSQAGKRLGKEDDRHLWPEMLRAIREIQPSWIVGENVLGITNWNDGLVFEEVQTDLEAEGYEVQAYILPAAGVNAPHQRYRTWFVANSNHSRHKARQEEEGKKNEVPGEYREAVESRESHRASIPGTDPNANLLGCEREREQGSIREEREGGKERFRELGNAEHQWEKFPTESPICNGNDGFSIDLDRTTFSKWRIESVKAGGNAIVPQVAFQIFKTIVESEKNKIKEKI